MIIPRVFAVIPVHNGIEHTLPAVISLLPLMPPPHRIVIIDDGSTDGTARTLRENHPDVIVLHGDGNLWWSGAMNLGARHALSEGADYVLFLNNDIVLEPNFLQELLKGAESFPRSLVLSKILSAENPDTIWSLGGKLHPASGYFGMVGNNTPDDGRYVEPFEVDWLPGMSVLIPIEVFREGIWVDEKTFPQYAGDSDFSIKARQAGYRLIVWPESRVYNKVSNSGITSRLLLRAEPFSWRMFRESLFSIKSSAAFCTFGRLVTRHTPLWSWPLVLGRFYGFYFLKCLQVALGLPAIRRKKCRTTAASGLKNVSTADQPVI
ncbi:MAG: glycosyltransferase family 2 protein [bacterium]|nr:glycosyltransferase family 2 protein [bacterium]